METLQPCIWFDDDAEAAAKLYTDLFARGRIEGVTRYGAAAAAASGRPQGSVMTVEFSLEALKFLALNGGPHFKPDPSISFLVTCESEAEIRKLWQGLCVTERMPLMKMPYADLFGWCADRFGVNWQLMLGGDFKAGQKISPALLFVQDKFGKCEEAVRFWTAQFPASSIDRIVKDPGAGAVMFSQFTIAGTDFCAMESSMKEHRFDFSCAISFVAGCDSQEEIDRIWSRLSAVPEAEQCGWLTDRYGVCWQVVPKEWNRWMLTSSAETQNRLMEAILQMKKPDLKKLEACLPPG